MGDDPDAGYFTDPLTGVTMSPQNTEIGLGFAYAGGYAVSLGVAVWGGAAGAPTARLLGQLGQRVFGRAFIDILEDVTPNEIKEDLQIAGPLIDNAFPAGLPPAGAGARVSWSAFLP